MQRYGTKGLALLLTLIATAFYAYCCFLGLNFWLEGKMVVSAVTVLVAIVVLAWAMTRMVRSKTTRNAREGRKHELRSGLVVMVIIIMGCPFFSKFMEVYDYSRQGILQEHVCATIDTVRVIDSMYISYADRRIKRMRRVSRVYAKSLSRRLKPEDIDSVAQERRVWLDKLSTPNIWNIYTATNINRLLSAGETWTSEYASMSAIIYKGEGSDTKPFGFDGATNKKEEFRQTFSKLHAPDRRGIIATVICLCIMMINYFVTRRVKTGVS